MTLSNAAAWFSFWLLGLSLKVLPVGTAYGTEGDERPLNGAAAWSGVGGRAHRVSFACHILEDW
jgi:hypothetical protein